MPPPLATWQRIYADPALLERAAAIDPHNAADLARLRQDYDADTCAVAFELVAARRKLEVKLPALAQRMVADIPGAEQASSLHVASHKARRFAALSRERPVLDLCCGIGGDAIGLQAQALHVEAVDLDPLRVWMAETNTGPLVTGQQADVADLDVTGRFIHLDPARRSDAGRRLFKLDDYQPGPVTIGRLIDQSDAAAIKLGPGIDLDALPWPGEIEFISERGKLVQAVLWTGELAQTQRTATLLGEAAPALTLAGSPAPLPLGPRRRYIHTVDPAVERAGLLGNLAGDLGVHAPHPALGLLTADEPIDSPWLTGFEVLEELPWRPAKVKGWLARNDGGIIEVKTRGKAVDPDPVARDLRGKGATPYTVFIHRWDTKKIALITKRL